MSARQSELASNLASVQEEIAAYQPTLIVVTKTYPISDVQILAELGAAHFGENRSDEGLTKSATVSATWHYQGEIQSKKIREILTWADCIHSLDQLRHAEKINAVLAESGESVDIFLQLSLDGDPQRGGLVEAELFTLAAELRSLPAINLMGLMSVPPLSLDVVAAFSAIAATHQRFIAEFPDSPYLSAGMSGDYMLALDHGATHIRVGSKILGARTYDQ